MIVIRPVNSGVERSAAEAFRSTATGPVQLPPRSVDPGPMVPEHSPHLIAVQEGQIVAALLVRPDDSNRPPVPGRPDMEVTELCAIESLHGDIGVLAALLKTACRRPATGHLVGRLLVTAPDWAIDSLERLGARPTPTDGVLAIDARELVAKDGDPSPQEVFAIPMERIVLSRGEVLYERGGHAASAFRVVRGSMLMEGLRQDGGWGVMDRVGPGGVLGEEAAVTGSRRPFRAVGAAASTDLLACPQASLQEHMVANPEFARGIHTTMIQRINRLTGPAEFAGDGGPRLLRLLRDRSMGRPDNEPVQIDADWLCEQTGMTATQLDTALDRLTGAVIRDFDVVVVMDPLALERALRRVQLAG